MPLRAKQIDVQPRRHVACVKILPAPARLPMAQDGARGGQGPFALEELRAAHARVRPYVNRTPVMTCATLDALTGGSKLFFKCESFQKVTAWPLRPPRGPRQRP
jgi:hypothetical protein